MTYDTCIEKLVQSRDRVVARHACKAVQVQMHVRHGKPALRAWPAKAMAR